MEQISGKKFSSPEEEIAFLRSQISERERELVERNKELDQTDIETAGRETLAEYGEYRPEIVLSKDHQLPDEHLARSVAELSLSPDRRSGEILSIAREKGIRNALSVLEKMGDAYLTDEVHRRIVASLRGGASVADLDESMPLFRVFNMTLFEVALPEQREEEAAADIRRLLSSMEQFYAGMQTIGAGKSPEHYTLEIAVSDKRDNIIFYVAVPSTFINLFEKQILSLFPHAVLTEQRNDYNIFVDGGESLVSVARQKKHPIYPIRTHDTFETDPLNVVLNAFSKIEREGGGAAIQLLIHAGSARYTENYRSIVKRVRDGMKPSAAIQKSTFFGDLLETTKEFMGPNTQSTDTNLSPEVDQDALAVFEKKFESPILATNLRIAVSAKTRERAEQIRSEIESGFHQFENTNGNTFVFKHPTGRTASRILKAFSFRQYLPKHVMPLTLAELSTVLHVPAEGVESAPQFKQSRAKAAPAPLETPEHGTHIGTNTYRNHATEIYMTPDDRLRHFYIVGQTGTGKTTLMKHMIAQDIEAGAGVCMIDPHGTDIADILSIIPDARKDDVIYFDPARTDRVMGLNMLEYDTRHPEQKTFVINELFSIFQKLYSANPEAMGPMFEQYFRNATALVLEDQKSGSTLLDVSRVLSDASYRREKLRNARNPVVTQFWSSIATKAGGEAALENIVPYITSKFDVFTANDYMRPIIGQQHSAFDFREIMDEQKILLVNLSKGRLGEINANLIGMIIVGKLLMAALSRVDDASNQFPPFYLHMDEFQNVTTDSISAILSEARKYKLGLTIAHQYIAQLDERIRDSVFGNVGSMAAFRVGPEDAEFLEHQFAPTFSASDLMNIENRNAYVRMLMSGTPSKPFNIKTTALAAGAPERAAEIIEHAYRRYGVPRRKVEMDISARYA